MFHRRCNEVRLTLRLQPATPLLIKAGEDPLDYLGQENNAETDHVTFGELVQQEQERIAVRKETEKARRDRQKQAREDGRGKKEKLEADMIFVRTRRNGQEQPYLPGSSLKGVLRSRSEQLAVTFGKPENICNILDQEGKSSGLLSCTKRVEGLDAGVRYKKACPVCKLYGCGGLAARLAVSDGYLTTRLEDDFFSQRSGVGINRQRGTAETQALFFYDVLQKGTFELTLTLENFELWQLGLTAYALDDLLHGRLAVGYGSQRGLGLMQGEVTAATLSYFGTNSQAAEGGCLLKGVARLASDPDGQYGFEDEDESEILPGATLTVSGLRRMWTLPGAAVEEMWRIGADAWRDVAWIAQEGVAE